jgi:hypothetical protein
MDSTVSIIVLEDMAHSSVLECQLIVTPFTNQDGIFKAIITQIYTHIGTVLWKQCCLRTRASQKFPVAC